MDVKKEIELAIKRENPNWDGKTFDYGCSIYKNALDCYEAIQPIIAEAGHSGFSYSMFVNIFTRLLKGKVLTPITEDDFDEEFPEKTGLGDEVREDGTIVRQCVRYSSLFRYTKPDGNKEYRDVDRVVLIDQNNSSWKSWSAEDKCKDIIPPITLPYMPSDTPIKIYAWTFCYEEGRGYFIERGEYNAMYIDKVVFPDGKAISVNRLYLDEDDKPITPTKEQYEELKTFIDNERWLKNVELCIKRIWENNDT